MTNRYMDHFSVFSTTSKKRSTMLTSASAPTVTSDDEFKSSVYNPIFASVADSAPRGRISMSAFSNSGTWAPYNSQSKLNYPDRFSSAGMMTARSGEIPKRPKRKRRRPVLVWIIIILFIIVIITIGTLLGILNFEEEKVSTVFVCGSAEKDQEVRNLIREASEESLSDTDLKISGVVLGCLPSRAFREINRTRFSDLDLLELSQNGISNISADAFLDGPFQSMKRLLLIQNEISNLPENLISNLKSLTVFQISESLITGIPNGFLEGSNLLVIIMNNNPGLVEIPREISGLKSLIVLHFRGCSALRVFDQNIFGGLPNLFELHLGGTIIPSLFNEDDFKREAGLKAGTNILGYDS